MLESLSVFSDSIQGEMQTRILLFLRRSFGFCADFIFYNIISRQIHGIDVLLKYPVFCVFTGRYA